MGIEWRVLIRIPSDSVFFFLLQQPEPRIKDKFIVWKRKSSTLPPLLFFYCIFFMSFLFYYMIIYCQFVKIGKKRKVQ